MAKNTAKAAEKNTSGTVKVRIKFGAYIVGSKAYGRGMSVEVPKEEADRLISLGVAEVVTETEKSAADKTGESADSGKADEKSGESADAGEADDSDIVA